MKGSMGGAVAICHILLIAGMLAAEAAGHVKATVEKVTFDNGTHRFSLSWQLDTGEVPVGCAGAFAILCGNAQQLPAQPDNYFPVVSSKGDTTISIESLRFDTTYRIGMWLRIQGVWYAPDTAAFYSVLVPGAEWEPVRLFGGSTGDTVSVFGKKVLFWRDASYGDGVSVHSDTVRYYTVPASRLKGFREAKYGFKFDDPVVLPEFFIGFRLGSFLKNNPRCSIYRDSAGSFFAEHGSVRDTARGILFVKTFRTDLPFLVLADTIDPRVEFNIDTGSVIGSKPLDLTFTVRDNSSGCRWRVNYGDAGERPFSAALHDTSGALHDTTAKISCQIPVTGAGEAGVRMYLTIDDGAQADTINVSHQASRSRCNETTTPANIILPLAPGATLDKSGCTDVLRSLFTITGGSYAIDQFRLYVWQSSGGKWDEYAPGNNAAFAFLPGRLYWLITKDAMPIDFGDGRSISLKDTLTIELPPRGWTDFSSPFSFPVAFEDISAASGEGVTRVSFYRWSKNTSHRTWQADTLYNRAVSGLNASSTVLSYGTNGYFTAYNPSDSTIMLRIPPVPPAKKTAKVMQLAGDSDGWTVRFDLEQDGETVGSVFCAASSMVKTAYTIPRPPAFMGSNSSITVNRPGVGEESGLVVYPLQSRDGISFELSAGNGCNANADVDVVPHIVAGTISGSYVIDNKCYAFPQRIPLAIGGHQFKKIVFRTGAVAEGGRISSPIVVAFRTVISAAANDRGVALRIDAPTSVNRIELFDLAGRKSGDAICGPLHGNTVIAGMRRGTISGVTVVRLTSGDGRRVRELHLGKAVLLR